MSEKTHDEIEALKKNWLNDPCWDIEDTEGFEEHHDELYIYRLEMELKKIESRKSRKICPLLSLAQGEFVPAICQEDECAWFITWKGENACALKVIAHESAYHLPRE
jgi:hypothetical protein